MTEDFLDEVAAHAGKAHWGLSRSGSESGRHRIISLTAVGGRDGCTPMEGSPFQCSGIQCPLVEIVFGDFVNCPRRLDLRLSLRCPQDASRVSWIIGSHYLLILIQQPGISLCGD